MIFLLTTSLDVRDQVWLEADAGAQLLELSFAARTDVAVRSSERGSESKWGKMDVGFAASEVAILLLFFLSLQQKAFLMIHIYKISISLLR